MTKRELHKKMFENIYDLIKGGAFEEEARKELKRFTKGKYIQWDGDNDRIAIGKYFIINLHY